MTRRPDSRSTAAPPVPNGASVAMPPAVRPIPDDALHLLSEWGILLALPRHCLKREARLGRLRVAKRAGRLWATGAWIRQWVEGGEVRRRHPADSPSTTSAETAT